MLLNPYRFGSASINSGWNPADAASGLLFSNNNKTVNGNSQAWHSVRAVDGRSSGLLYYEIATGASYVSADNAEQAFGIVDSTTPLTGDPLFGGIGGKNVVARLNNQYSVDGVYQGTSGGNSPGGANVYGFAIDFSTRTATFYLNGAQRLSRQWGTGATLMYPFFSGGPTTDAATLRLTAAEFTQAIPATYSAWS